MLNISFSPGSLVAPVFVWLSVNFSDFFSAIATAVEWVIDSFSYLLIAPPPLSVIAFFIVLGFVTAGWRTAVLIAILLPLCAVLGLWQVTMQTAALIVLAVLAAALVALPLGIGASRRRVLQAALTPVLDTMQTLPAWVYLVPMVILFGQGKVPGLLGTVIFAVPPLVRLTIVAMNSVPAQRIELGKAIGATPLQILRKIEIPSALPTMMVGLNQCILFALAMTVLAGLVGGGGLGGEVTRGMTRLDFGLGTRASLCIVFLALIIDRWLQAGLHDAKRLNSSSEA